MQRITAEPETLRLYDYAASANCFKVRLLLATLGRPYERVPVDIFAGETLGDDYYRINPARTTPVLEVGAGNYLPESNAILAYLAEGTPLLPDDRFLRAQVLRWLLFEQADVVPTMGGLRFRLLTGRLAPDDAEARRRHDAAEATLEVLDSHLRNAAFFVADRYTIADMALYGYTHVAHEGGIDMNPYARVRGWLARVEAEPGFVNDLEPYPENAQPGAAVSIYDPVKET